MSRDPRAHCAVSPFFLFPRVSLSTLLQTVREEILERSWRDSVSREYRCREDSLYPRILLCAASLASPAFLSFHRFLVLLPLLLSFNLRLDCRLHIVLFSLLSCPILNFSSVLRVPLCFPLLFFFFHPLFPICPLGPSSVLVFYFFKSRFIYLSRGEEARSEIAPEMRIYSRVEGEIILRI